MTTILQSIIDSTLSQPLEYTNQFSKDDLIFRAANSVLGYLKCTTKYLRLKKNDSIEVCVGHENGQPIFSYAKILFFEHHKNQTEHEESQVAINWYLTRTELQNYTSKSLNKRIRLYDRELFLSNTIQYIHLETINTKINVVHNSKELTFGYYLCRFRVICNENKFKLYKKERLYPHKIYHLLRHGVQFY